MVMTYTCIRKCYFREGIRNVGDRMILDSSVGDACPHLVRTPSEEQLAMQAYTEKEKKAEVCVPKAQAKAVSGARKNAPKNGGKAE